MGSKRALLLNGLGDLLKAEIPKHTPTSGWKIRPRHWPRCQFLVSVLSVNLPSLGGKRRQRLSPGVTRRAPTKPTQVLARWHLVTSRNTKGHRMAPMPKSGGGGDRTRVPRHFHAGFYVRSPPNLQTVVARPPDRQGCRLTSRQQFLIPGVADGDPRRSGITAGSRDSPAKSLSRGCLVRQPEPCYWQLSFGLLFAWPADQPRYATCTSRCPVESNSPPEVLS